MNNVKKADRDGMVAFARGLVELDAAAMCKNQELVIAALIKKFSISTERARSYTATAIRRERYQQFVKPRGRPSREGQIFRLPIRVADVSVYNRIVEALTIDQRGDILQKASHQPD